MIRCDQAVSRREILRSVGLSLAALAAGTSGTTRANTRDKTLHLLVPPGFEPDTCHKQFEKDSGYRLTTTYIDDSINLATQWQRHGADLCLASGHDAPFWRDRNLLDPWQQSLLPELTLIHEPLLRTAFDHWRFNSNSPAWLPTTWGAEGIAWRTDMRTFKDSPSYADVWEAATPNSTLIRPESALRSVAYLLEHEGVLPAGSVLRSEYDRQALRLCYERALAYMAQHKDRLKLTWNDATTQIHGLLDDGAITGQTWDAPAIALKAVGEPVDFRAPVEGALCWSTGWLLSRQSQHKDAAHAFLAACLTPQYAIEAARIHGFQSAVRVPSKPDQSDQRDPVISAYSDTDIARLRPMPQQSAWFRADSREYATRFLRMLAS